MAIRIYLCPLATGWVRYDVSIDGVHVQDQCLDALDAYEKVQHFDQNGHKISVDVPGWSLKKLREQYRNSFSR
jgi:hypothetical protein